MIHSESWQFRFEIPSLSSTCAIDSLVDKSTPVSGVRDLLLFCSLTNNKYLPIWWEFNSWPSCHFWSFYESITGLVTFFHVKGGGGILFTLIGPRSVVVTLLAANSCYLCITLLIVIYLGFWMAVHYFLLILFRKGIFYFIASDLPLNILPMEPVIVELF